MSKVSPGHRVNDDGTPLKRGLDPTNTHYVIYKVYIYIHGVDY